MATPHTHSSTLHPHPCRLTDNKVVPWLDGCRKGLLHAKSKGLHSAVTEVHIFLQTGMLPAGWWQQAHKLSPVKKAAAAAPGADPASPRAAAEKAQPRKQAPSKAAGASAAEGDVEMEEAAGAAGPDAQAPQATKAALTEPATEPAQLPAAQALLPAAGGSGGSSLGGAAAGRAAGSGSTSTRDMLRSVFNRIKLLHPAAARLETPNSVVDLLAALRKHFGPAMALATEQLVRKGGRDCGARSWVLPGSAPSY